MNKKILILGGGFAGVYIAKDLLKKGQNVTLINNKNYFLFTPLLVSAAMGVLNLSDIIFDYLSFYKNKKFIFIRDEIEKINFEKNEIKLKNNSNENYDYLIIATGSTTNYYNLKGREFTYSLKTIQDARNIKKKIIELTSSNKKDNLNINIVGAGPTGIELSLEISDLIKQIQKEKDDKISCQINLINSGDNILPQLKEKNQKYVKQIIKKNNINLILNANVEQIMSENIKYNNKIECSSMTIWTAGVKPNTKIIDKKYLDQRNKIIVNKYLQLNLHKNVFALGDVMTQLEQRIPPLAQTATKQAEIVAKNILNKINNKPLIEYKLKLKGVFISLGNKKAVGEIGNLSFKSNFAWFIWRTIYLFKMPGISNKLKIMFTWTINIFSKKNLIEE